MKATYKYKDQDWSRGMTAYWFDVEGEDIQYAKVEGEPGYDHIINEYGSVVFPEELDSDLIVTDEMRAE